MKVNNLNEWKKAYVYGLEDLKLLRWQYSPK